MNLINDAVREKLHLGLILSAFTVPIYAQTPPFAISAMDGSQVMFLRLGSKSDCTITERVTFGSQSAETSKTGVFDYTQDPSNKRNYLGFGTEANGVEVKLVFESDARGASLLPSDPEIRMASPLSPRDQANMVQMFRPVLNLVQGWVNSILARPLSQGMTIDLPSVDICQLATGTPGKPMAGTTKIAGVTVKDGRSLLMLESNMTLACSVKGNAFDMSMKSWFGYDIESGLPADKYETGYASMPGVGSLVLTTDQRCKVTSPAGPRPGRTSSSTESRLTELKSLFDKGLISKEVYDQRMREIVGSL